MVFVLLRLAGALAIGDVFFDVKAKVATLTHHFEILWTHVHFVVLVSG